jgi:hypothetical protein
LDDFRPLKRTKIRCIYCVMIMNDITGLRDEI